MDVNDVKSLMATPQSPTNDYNMNVKSPDIYQELQQPPKVVCEDMISQDCIVKSETIYVKNETPIKFIIENVEKLLQLTIEAKLEHFDHRNIPILPCSDCKAEYIFKVKESTKSPPPYHLEYLPGIGEDKMVQVTFSVTDSFFRNLEVIFYCSASHKFQDVRFRLIFKMKDQVISMFLVEVTPSPMRSYKNKSEEFDFKPRIDNDSVGEEDDDFSEPKSKIIKIEEQETENYHIVIQNPQHEEYVKNHLDRWSIPYDIFKPEQKP